jgi:molybdopterin synthase sulfur carrier subunit
LRPWGTSAVIGFEKLNVEGPAMQRSVLDALEARCPLLGGTIRDHVTHQRRAIIRFFACAEYLSNEPPDASVTDAVSVRDEAYFVVGTIADG